MHQIIRRTVVSFFILFTGSFSLLLAEPSVDPSTNTLSAQTDLSLPEVVVSTNRLDTPVSQVANSLTVITAKDMEQKQAGTALAALQGVPGLNILQNGGPGETSGLFMRGADAGHTLVLMDGIPLNSSISPSSDFEYLDQIFTDDIQQIEVVRGPLSTVYGSQATAGVVNIITQPGQETPKGSLLFEGGAYQTFREAANASIGTNSENMALSVSRYDTQGFPSADKSFGNTVNNSDGNTTASLRLGFLPTANLDNSLFARYSDSHTNVDAQGGAGGDDPNYFLDDRLWVVGSQSKWRLLDGTWEQVLGISYRDDFQTFTDDFSSYLNSHYERGAFEGQTAQLNWQNNLHLWKGETLVAGLQAQQEWGRENDTTDYGYGLSNTSINTSVTTGSYFAESQTELMDRLFATIGGRLDAVSSFGSQWTYRGAVAYFIPGSETKLKATYGTGFAAPTIFQLYSPYGNTSLKAENSQGWDAGFEQPFVNNALRVGATYFQTNYTNLINFLSTATPPYGEYFNVSKASTEGWEIFLSVKPIKDLECRADYTYTWAFDADTGAQLIRRPQNKADFSASYQWGTANLGFNVAYVGDRPDLDFSTFPANPITLPSYTLVNLMASVQLDDHFNLFGRVNNLFNTFYEQIYGYGTPGISFYMGTKVSL